LSDYKPYNPLDKRNLGASVAEALLSRKPVSLGALERFDGAGVYAIDYVGDFEAYRPVSELNRNGDIKAPIPSYSEGWQVMMVLMQSLADTSRIR
jgi:hypothetical protein